MNKKKSKLLSVFGLVLDFVPIFLTVAVGFLASLYGVKAGLSTAHILQVILLVLTLLATSLLLDRYRVIRNIERKLEDINQNSSANAFFIEAIPDLTERLKIARTVSISGITLARASSSFYNLFDGLLSNGASIRLQMVSPEQKAIDIVSKRFQKHQNVKSLKSEAYLSLDNFRSLVLNNSYKGSFEIKHIDFVPSCGIWIIDENTSNAEIWVEMYIFRDTPEPTFKLTPINDGVWFEYFKNQFELMWNVGTTWTANKSK